MRLIVSLCLCTMVFTKLNSQTHHLGLNFGINQILNFQEEPPFGDNSPWKSTLGLGYELSYHYTFKNNLTLGLGLGYLQPKFIEYDESIFIEELNENVIADRVLILTYINYNLFLGYKWQLSDRYSIQVGTGPSILYEDKQKTYSKGFKQTLSIRDFEFSRDQINYGITLNVEQAYTLIQDWNYRLNLIASVRNTYIIDYLHIPNSINRLLPQAYLGLELELGRRQR